MEELSKMKKRALSKSLDKCNWLAMIKDPANATKHRETHAQEMKAINSWAEEWKSKLSRR